MANRKVTLLWYCKTPNGWRRYPVVMGGNNRIKHGYVEADSVLTHYPEGRYELRFYEGTKPIWKRAGTNAADALAARDREVHLLTTKDAASKAGVKIIEETGRLYLRRAAIKFEEDAKDRNALEAAEVNRLVCEEFIAVTGLVYADEITREHVFKFHRALRARGLSDRTLANKHARLRSFLRYCKLDYKDILPPTPKYDATLPDTYTLEQTGKILGVADAYMRLAIELGLMCGLRDQELMHIEWVDIHWAESTLRVTSKPHWGFKIKDSEERDIPIPSELLTHLRKWKTRDTQNKESRLILPTSGGKPNGKLLRTLKRLAKAHGLNCGVCDGCESNLGECQDWTLHKLRRTYCTTLLQNGMDLRTVQHFMGHADLASTMRYLKPASSKESQVKINKIKWSK
jgi:integrase